MCWENKFGILKGADYDTLDGTDDKIEIYGLFNS